MAYYKINFITLSSVQIKDTKYLVKVYSRKNGVFELNISGVGKAGSRFSKLNMPGYLCEGIAYQKKNDSALYLTDCEIKKSFIHLRNSHKGLSILSYVCWLISRIIPEKIIIGGLFDEFVFFLENVEIPDFYDALIFTFFVLKRTGYLPELDNYCSKCGKLFEQKFFIDEVSNEILCSECFSGKSKNFFRTDFIIFYNSLYNYSMSKLVKLKKHNVNQLNLEIFLSYFIINIDALIQKKLNMVKTVNE